MDFTCSGISTQGNPVLEADPGGAPCNVLSMLQNLGKSTAFIGKVGDDVFGRMLADAVKTQGINTDNLVVDPEVHTTLAFVHTKKDGDREFSFYRNPGADMMLRWEEVQQEKLAQTRIFHFGTLSMTHEQVKDATQRAVQHAQKEGALISFDPNLRPPLWNSLEDAARQMWYGIGQCDINMCNYGKTWKQGILSGKKRILRVVSAGRHDRDHRGGRYLYGVRFKCCSRKRT